MPVKRLVLCPHEALRAAKLFLSATSCMSQLKVSLGCLAEVETVCCSWGRLWRRVKSGVPNASIGVCTTSLVAKLGSSQQMSLAFNRFAKFRHFSLLFFQTGHLFLNMLLVRGYCTCRSVYMHNFAELGVEPFLVTTLLSFNAF